MMSAFGAMHTFPTLGLLHVTTLVEISVLHSLQVLIRTWHMLMTVFGVVSRY